MENEVTTKSGFGGDSSDAEKLKGDRATNKVPLQTFPLAHLRRPQHASDSKKRPKRAPTNNKERRLTRTVHGLQQVVAHHLWGERFMTFEKSHYGFINCTTTTASELQ